MSALGWSPSDWRLIGLAIQVDTARDFYAASDKPHVKSAMLVSQTVSLIEYDRICRARAKEAEDRRKTVYKSPQKWHMDFGLVVKNPFAVVRITGV